MAAHLKESHGRFYVAVPGLEGVASKVEGAGESDSDLQGTWPRTGKGLQQGGARHPTTGGLYSSIRPPKFGGSRGFFSGTAHHSRQIGQKPTRNATTSDFFLKRMLVHLGYAPEPRLLRLCEDSQHVSHRQ